MMRTNFFALRDWTKYALGRRAHKPKIISRTGFSISRKSFLLAIRAAAVATKLLRRLGKAALERTSEAGRMLVTHCAGDLLDAHLAAFQQVGGYLQLLFGQQVTEAKTGLPLEQMLKMRLAQIELACQIANITGPSGSDYFEYLVDARLLQLMRR
ncbi:MAG TPA: hypothetical protein VEM34_00905 [Burkholderiales bacterium]|nr:hypothetical protein [Burkholderiales bacterium]